MPARQFTQTKPLSGGGGVGTAVFSHFKSPAAILAKIKEAMWAWSDPGVGTEKKKTHKYTIISEIRYKRKLKNIDFDRTSFKTFFSEQEVH